MLYYILYHIVGYRKKVVFKNLTNSFPHKPKEEITTLAKAFYRHLSDLIVESVKLFSISEKEVLKRFKVVNPEVLDAYADKNQSVILIGGHYSNWEMLAVAINLQIKHQPVALYTKLSNPFFEKVMLSSRGKYGLRMISTKNIGPFFNGESDHNTATIFGADQSPTHNKKVVWTTFLNQETALAFGSEKYAKLKDYPVVFGAISKVKRGHYEFKLSVITDKPNETEHGYISVQHTKKLEQQILEKPEFWLWTHKRWKRVRKPEEEVL